MGDITGAVLTDALFRLFDLDSEDGMHDDYAVWRARILFDHYHPQLDSPMDCAGLRETIRRVSGDPRAYVMFSYAIAAWVCAVRGIDAVESYESEGDALAETVILLARIKQKKVEAE